MTFRVGYCPLCNTQMFSICPTCGGTWRKPNAMQITLKMHDDRNHVIPLCDRHPKISLKEAQRVYDLGIEYNIKQNFNSTGKGDKVKEVLYETLVRQTDVR